MRPHTTRTCFCGCGRSVGWRLRRFDRHGRAATKVLERLTGQALPLLAEHRTDHRMLRFVAETERLAREGPSQVEHLRAIVHGEAKARAVPGLADWQRATRERGDTIVITAALVAAERERGF